MFNIFKKSSTQYEHQVKSWYGENHAFLQNIEEQNRYFLEQWLAYRYQEQKEYYQSLKSFIIFLQNTKQVCIDKGNIFEKWFYDTIATDEYISDRIQELKKIERKVNL